MRRKVDALKKEEKRELRREISIGFIYAVFIAILYAWAEVSLEPVLYLFGKIPFSPQRFILVFGIIIFPILLIMSISSRRMRRR